MPIIGSFGAGSKGGFGRGSARKPYFVDFLVVAGGGGGGHGHNVPGCYTAGGGGAGGYRNSYNSEPSGGGSSSQTELTFVPKTVYTISVGGGGFGANLSEESGGQGGVSSIVGDDITPVTTVGGGKGSGSAPTFYPYAGSVGGSGGGGSCNRPGYAGTADEGYSGSPSGGGGGASSIAPGTAGGSGLSSSITGSAVPRAVGGTSGNRAVGPANSGYGGGSGISNAGGGGSGGSGVVVLRMPSADYTGTTTGSPTVSDDGDYKVLVYTGSGSYTA